MVPVFGPATAMPATISPAIVAAVVMASNPMVPAFATLVIVAVAVAAILLSVSTGRHAEAG